jgi:protein TonB
VYPESARKDSVEGTVLVVAFIDEKGMVRAVRIEKSIRKDLNEAASQAVMQSRFKPAMLHGKPVKSRLTIPVRFKLRSLL